MQVHLTAAPIALQDNQTQSSRESLSVHEFRASNSTVFQSISEVNHGGWKHTLGLFDFMRRRKDRLPPDKSNAFW